MFTKNHFPHQKEGEQILIFLRRHWFVLFKSSLLYVLLLIIPVILYFVISNSSDIFQNPNFVMLLILAASLYYLFVWLFFYNNFIDYYLDVWMVTNKRVINIEQQNLFSRTIAVQELHKLQDAASEVKGFFPTFLDYGDVYVQTAGEKGRFIFKQVPNAHRVAQKIVQLLQRERMKRANKIKDLLDK